MNWEYVLFFTEIGIKKVLKESLFLFVQSCRKPVNEAELKMSYLE